MRSTKVDATAAVNEYIDKQDWRINANANTNYSHASLINNLAGKLIANYWLDSVYSKEEGDAHRNGDYHIHDLDILGPYCFTGDTQILLADGRKVTMRELVRDYAEATFEVYSVDEQGRSVVGTAYAPRLTRKKAGIVEVVFQDGSRVRCTPDHPFLTVNGDKLEWVNARDLQQGTRCKCYIEGVVQIVDAVYEQLFKEDVYDLTVDTVHNFALANGVIVHNCCGHDFQKILDEGFNGVIGRVGSKPPKHFREALYQLANYFGILQAEWAGAQAVSSFDTYLAPHVFFDTQVCGLTYDDVKKAMRNFVFNLNVPSRWGQCVPSTYKCLKADGTWVNYENLKVGDEIYVVDMETGKLKKDTVTHVNVFDSPEKLHYYTDGDGFGFMVTDKHRIIHQEEDGKWVLTESAELFKKTVQAKVPVSLWSPMTLEEFTEDEYEIPDHLLELLALLSIHGNLVGDNVTVYSGISKLTDHITYLCDELGLEYKVSDCCDYLVDITFTDVDQNKMLAYYFVDARKNFYELASKLSPRQASIIIDTCSAYSGQFDGNYWQLKSGSQKEAEYLAGLIIRTGKAVSYDDEGRVFIHKRGPKEVYGREVESPYSKVWCPTTNTGTFVCMGNGGVFFTGNSPFTNVTIDWTVPNLMKDMAPTRGGINFFQSILNEWGENEKSKAVVEAIKQRFKEIDPESYEMLKDDDSALMLSFTYRFFQKEMNIINKAFYEVLNEGDMLGQPFTFPIPTINITEDFDWDGENTDLLFENTAKYGSSYFQNFIGSQYMLDENGNKVRDPNAYTPNDVRSMCPLALNTPVITNHGIKRLDRLNEQTDKVMLHGVWYSFRKVTNIPEQRVLVITLDGLLSDGKPIQFVVGEDHLQPIYDQSTGTYLKRACKYLNTSDYIPVEEVYHADDGQHVRPEGNRFIIGTDHLQYIQIKNIREIPTEQLMCIEVDNEEHNFTLGNGIITSNCRLQLDKKQLRLKGGGIFGSDAKTGSLSVVTINCPRLGYLCKGDKKKLYKKLDHLLDLAKSTHEKKRKFVLDMLGRGLYPYTRRYIGSFDTYFSTIGVNGINEMIRNFTNDEHDITDEYGQSFAKELLDHIRTKLVDYQEETGNLYNLEATPAEGTMRRFAHSDKEKYPDIIQAGFSDSLPYYTNSSQLPVEFTEDVFTALDLQDVLQKKYTGGCCAAGNFVLTDKGEMLIEDIVKNFNPDDNLKVMSWNNETKEAEWDKVVDAMAIDVSQHDKIKVSLSAGELGAFGIITSDWHPFLVKKDKDVIEVRADELEAGMEVLGWHETYTVEDTSKVDVEDNQFYDLTTERNHNYLCGNNGGKVFVHNTVFHVYTRERVSSAESCKRLVRTILSNYRLPYISITPTFSVCPIHGRIEGEHEFCPKCDEELIKRHAEEVDPNL